MFFSAGAADEMVEGLGDMDLETYDDDDAAGEADGSEVHDDAVITFKQHKGRRRSKTGICSEVGLWL